MGYNADLYENYSIASSSPHGLVAVSVMLQIGQLSNTELRRITEAALNIKFGGIFIIYPQNEITRIQKVEGLNH